MLAKVPSTTIKFAINTVSIAEEVMQEQKFLLKSAGTASNYTRETTNHPQA